MTQQYPNKCKCPMMDTLNQIGGKWKIQVLWQLYRADLRYNELKRRLGDITNIMLTRSLRDLEEAGLVNRVQYSESPPHVTYSLTAYSRNLGSALLDINDWGEQMQSAQNETTQERN